MTEPEIDLRDVDRTEPTAPGFHNADGTDWRIEPYDDEAVMDALHSGAEPELPEDAPDNG